MVICWNCYNSEIHSSVEDVLKAIPDAVYFPPNPVFLPPCAYRKRSVRREITTFPTCPSWRSPSRLIKRQRISSKCSTCLIWQLPVLAPARANSDVNLFCIAMPWYTNYKSEKYKIKTNIESEKSSGDRSIHPKFLETVPEMKEADSGRESTLISNLIKRAVFEWKPFSADLKAALLKHLEALGEGVVGFKWLMR